MIYVPLIELKKLHSQNKAEYNRIYYTLDENRRKRFYVGRKNGTLQEFFEDKNSVEQIINNYTSDSLSQDVKDALYNANLPSLLNPFATINDIPTLGYTPEDIANKSIDVNADQGSNIKYPSVKAVYDWGIGLFQTAFQVSSAITTALTGYATQAWVTSQGYITNVITALGYTPENVANKETTALDTSTTKYPCNNVVKTAVDAKQDALGYTPENVANKSTDTALGSSNTLYPSQNAVKTYVDNRSVLKRSTSTTVTSSTTLGTINNLTHSVAANEVWYFEASGSVSCSSTSGARLGIAIPTGATVYYEMQAANSTVGNITSNSGSFTTSSEIVQTFAAVASTNMWWRITGVLVNGSNSGSLTIQGKTVNVVNTVTFNVGCRLKLDRE